MRDPSRVRMDVDLKLYLDLPYSLPPECLRFQVGGFWEEVYSIIITGKTEYISELTEMFSEKKSLSNLELLLFMRLRQIEKDGKNALALLEIFYLEIALQFFDFLFSQNSCYLDSFQFGSNATFFKASNLPYLYCSVSNSSFLLVHESLFDYLKTHEGRFLEYLISYYSKFESARKQQIRDFVILMSKIGSLDDFWELIDYPELVIRDLAIPPILVVVPTFKDDPVFFSELFSSAIERWKNKIKDLSERRVANCNNNYETTLRSIPPNARFHNLGLVFVAKPNDSEPNDSEPNDRLLKDNCYLDYFNHYSQKHPLTGEISRYPRTYNHEGYGHGIFELTLLSGFLKLVQKILNKKSDFGLIRKINADEIRMGSIFGEAWAGYFCEDPRCARLVRYYPTFQSVLQDPCVFADHQKDEEQGTAVRFELGYIAGPRFWMSIEIALQEALLKAEDLLKSNANVSDGDQSSLTSESALFIQELTKISRIIPDLNLRKSVRYFLFLEMLRALSSVYQEIDDINYTTLSELIVELTRLCLNQLLLRLSRIGINQEQIEKIYSSFSSLNDMFNRYPKNLTEFLSFRLGLDS